MADFGLLLLDLLLYGITLNILCKMMGSVDFWIVIVYFMILDPISIPPYIYYMYLVLGVRLCVMGFVS